MQATPAAPLQPQPASARRAKWQRPWIGWATLLLLTLLVRGGVLIVQADDLAADIDGYRWLAESLAVHDVYGAVDQRGVVHPTAFRPPLYPWLLSWCVSDGQLNDLCVRGLHLLLGLGTVAGTYWLGQRMLGGWAGWWAGGLVALDPILLIQSTRVMTETLAVALVVGCLVLWATLVRCQQDAPHRVGWNLLLTILLAAALTAAFFCRPTFLIWAMLWCGWLVLRAFAAALWGSRGDGLPYGRPVQSLVTACVIAIFLLASISRWAYRNDQQLGHPVWATSHGGYTLLLGNNPPFYDYLREGSFGVAWDAEPFHRAWTTRYQSDPMAETFWQQHAQAENDPPIVQDEVADDRLAYEVARETIRRQPAMFVWACVVRVGRLWSPLPHITENREGSLLWMIAGYYLACWLLVGIGAVRLGRRLLRPEWMAGILLAIALTSVHVVYWSNMRMRAPATPVLALAAAAGIGWRKAAPRS